MNDPRNFGDLTLLRILRENAPGESLSEDAAEEFVVRYMQQLLSLVNRNLAARFRTRVDPEDIGQSVFRSWFSGVKSGRIDPSSKDEVWRLLSVIALNKTRNKVRHHEAQKHDVRRTEAGEGILPGIPRPTDADATVFVDWVDSIGRSLDTNPRQTLELILQGLSVQEIADELGVTTKSVTRYKKRIGEVLESYLNEEVD